jgi:superkiller protein 3
MIAALALFLVLATPASFEDLLRTGLLALQKGDLQGDRTRLEAASKLEQRNPRVWLGLAQTYWKLKEPQLAGAAAQHAETLSPDDPAVLDGLLFYYSESGGHAKVIELGGRAIQKEDRANVRELLAKAYVETRQPEKAVTEFEAALRLRPYEEAYYFELAQLLLRLQKFDAALEILNTGTQRFDKSAQLELARGVALYGLRRFPEAIDSFLRTIQLAPEVPQPYLFLGRMLDQAESKLPDAVQAFAALAKSDPANFMGSLLYAKALIAQSGDSAQAESLLRESIRRKNDYWESHFELGLLLERRRQFAESAGELEKAVALNPEDATAHYHLARVYDRLGKTTAAAAQRALHAKLSSRADGGSGAMGLPAPVLK